MAADGRDPDVLEPQSFSTYDQKLARSCEGNQTFEQCYNISMGLLHNDLWSYDLSVSTTVGPTAYAREADDDRAAMRDCLADCQRWADQSCRYQGWTQVDQGAYLGGCEFFAGVLRCTHPSERYDQSAVLFNGKRLFVFGGFSQKCQDYCSDMWELDIQVRNTHPVRCRGSPLKAHGSSREFGPRHVRPKDDPAARGASWESWNEVDQVGVGDRP